MQGGLKKTRAKNSNCVALIQISGTVERRGRRKEKELSLLQLRVDKRRTRKEYFKQYSVPKSRHHFHRGAQGHCAIMLCKHQRPLSLSLSPMCLLASSHHPSSSLGPSCLLAALRHLIHLLALLRLLRLLSSLRYSCLLRHSFLLFLLSFFIFSFFVVNGNIKLEQKISILEAPKQ